MLPHPGIRIDKIPVEGAGGLMFVLGISALFLIGIPAFTPLVILSVVGGALLALALPRLRGH